MREKRTAGAAVVNRGGAGGRGWCRQVGPVGQRERMEGKVSWAARGLNGPSELAGPRGEKEVGSLRFGRAGRGEEVGREKKRKGQRPGLHLGWKEKPVGLRRKRGKEKEGIRGLNFLLFCKLHTTKQEPCNQHMMLKHLLLLKLLK
jgi:hypothetical protein